MNKEEKIKEIIEVLEKKGLGSPAPLLSLPFLDWFNSYDFSKFTMVEVGAGLSTDYFANRVKFLKTFETSKEYYDLITYNKKENVQYVYQERETLESGNFEIESPDIVFVDCDASRYQISLRLLEKHLPSIFILDNSEWFPYTCKAICDRGYSEIIFWGIRINEELDKGTSIFIKNGYKLPNRNYNYYAVGSEEHIHRSEGLSIEDLKKMRESIK